MTKKNEAADYMVTDMTLHMNGIDSKDRFILSLIFFSVEYFESFRDFYKRYYELLNELDDRNLICSAFLNVDGERMFWESEKNKLNNF